MQSKIAGFLEWWKRYAAGIFGLLILAGGLLWQIAARDTEISVDERRRLAQSPVPAVKTVLSAEFMQDAEKYFQDQFPGRQAFRRLKAQMWYQVLRMTDYEGIYLADGYAAELDDPLSESSVTRFTEKMTKLKERYFPQSRAYMALIPLKNHFLAEENGCFEMDYGRMMALLEEGMKGFSVLDLTPYLEAADYYRTDIHWRQERIPGVASALLEWMDAGTGPADGEMSEHVAGKFYGSYYGQAALPMAAEDMIYLTNPATESSVVWHLESGAETGVYDLDKLTDPKSLDMYDIYLSGADALQVITNPAAKEDRELIVFRDSFGSSLIPLMLSAYSKVTMIDLRYISSELLGKYVDFEGESKTSGKFPDVLVIYNTNLVNQSAMLR